MFDTTTDSPEARAAALAAQTGGPAPAVLDLSGRTRQTVPTEVIHSVRPVEEDTVADLIISGATEAEIAAHLDAKRLKAEAAAAAEIGETAEARRKAEAMARLRAAQAREQLIAHFRQEVASVRVTRSLPALSAEAERAAAIRLMDYQAIPPADRERVMSARYLPDTSTASAPPVAGHRWNAEGTELVPFYASTAEGERARAMGLRG